MKNHIQLLLITSRNVTTAEITAQVALKGII